MPNLNTGMNYTITIRNDSETQIYSQTVEALNLMAVIQAINSAPEPVKQKKPRKDKGISRKKEQASAGLEGK